MVFNGKQTREWLSKGDTSIPTEPMDDIYILWKQLMHMRYEISWLCVLPTH